MSDNNITLQTKGGYTVVLASYITGRQKRFITDAFLEDVSISSTGGNQSFSIQGTKANVANDRAIQSVVQSIEGPNVKAEAPILDKVLDLPAEDYDEVMAKIEEITGDKKKVKSTTTT